MITDENRAILKQHLPINHNIVIAQRTGKSKRQCNRVFNGEVENLTIEEAFTNLAAERKAKKERLQKKQQQLKKAS